MTDRNHATSSAAALTERAERLVRQEVHMCLSSLVSTLANAITLSISRSGSYGVPSDSPAAMNERAMKELVEQAFELSSPVLDYEEAARQAGWQTREEAEWAFTGGKFIHRKSTANDSAKTWEALCDEEGIEPYEWEIFEHWAVSEWFGRQLASQGERVDFDFAGMVVWGRTTTGQGIAMDSVVLKIAAELLK